jgi:phenylalanyl-tRNA synthetase beta chain
LPNEVKVLTLVMTGSEILGDWVSTARSIDFFDLKGAVETALYAAGVDGAVFIPAEIEHLRAGQTAEIAIDGTVLGYAGRLSDAISAGYKFRQNVYVAELNLDRILAVQTGTPVYKPLSRYPAVVRDISLLVPRTMSFDQIRGAILEQQFELCRNISFVDVFEGKGISPDQRSLTLRLEYRSEERTLLEEEVDAVHTRILESLESSLGLTVPR